MICGAGSATPHLLIEDGTTHPTTHYQMENFPAVKAGIQHANADGHLRILLSLEFADEIVGVCNVARDDLSILALEFWM